MFIKVVEVLATGGTHSLVTPGIYIYIYIYIYISGMFRISGSGSGFRFFRPFLAKTG